jgi:hypothetical protein
MWDGILAAAGLCAVGHRGPDVVLEAAGRGSGFCDINALFCLNLDGLVSAVLAEMLEEIGQGEDGIGAFECGDKGRVTVICLEDFSTASGQ